MWVSRPMITARRPRLPCHRPQTPDPQDPRGIRHSLASQSLAALATALAGRSRWPRSASGPRTAQLLAALEIRHDPLAGGAGFRAEEGLGTLLIYDGKSSLGQAGRGTAAGADG